MGAFDDVSPITLPENDEQRKKWRWEPHEQVVIKGSITVADQEYISNHYGKSSKSGQIEFQMGTGRYALLDLMILSWTLTHHGQRVPVTPENIRRLPANYSNPILEVCDRLAASMSEQEQEDFLDSASAPIAESSESAKLSLMS